MKKQSLLISVIIIATSFILMIGSAFALPTLPTNEITKMKFTNFEEWNDVNANGVIDMGDSFWGILDITTIGNIGLTNITWSLPIGPRVDELTGIFKVSVVDGSLGVLGGHLDFDLLAGDYVKMFYDTTPNWSPGSYLGGDPTLSVAWANASDGTPYITLDSTKFYEGINDSALLVGSVNRNWADLVLNGTGYTIVPQLWPEIIGGPAFVHSYFLDGIPGNDPELAFLHPAGHVVDVFFENHLFPHTGAGVWDFRSEDPVYLWAVPEPGTLILLGTGLIGVAAFRRKLKK